jgi:hypothetical protein
MNRYDRRDLRTIMVGGLVALASGACMVGGVIFTQPAIATAGMLGASTTVIAKLKLLRDDMCGTKEYELLDTYIWYMKNDPGGLESWLDTLPDKDLEFIFQNSQNP